MEIKITCFIDSADNLSVIEKARTCLILRDIRVESCVNSRGDLAFLKIEGVIDSNEFSNLSAKIKNKCQNTL